MVGYDTPTYHKYRNADTHTDTPCGMHSLVSVCIMQVIAANGGTEGYSALYTVVGAPAPMHIR